MAPFSAVFIFTTSILSPAGIYLAPEHWCLLGTPWLINASPSLLSHPVSQSTASVPPVSSCWTTSFLVMNHPMSAGAAANRVGGGRKNAGAHKSRVPSSISDLREAHLNLRVMSQLLCILAWLCPTHFCYCHPCCYHGPFCLPCLDGSFL